jgi:hypothetical protein
MFSPAEARRDSVGIKDDFTHIIPFDVNTAEIIKEEITKKLERDGLNLEDCRGQPYDNQAEIAGVQKRILRLNSFVPCNKPHSLPVLLSFFWYCGTSVLLLFMFNSCAVCSEIIRHLYSKATF